MNCIENEILSPSFHKSSNLIVDIAYLLFAFLQASLLGVIIFFTPAVMDFFLRICNMLCPQSLCTGIASG